ncbi:hypothetical protein [Nocardioides sp.]|uniref:hypothetical protein n=1 Tax=Nocardioides sp. TaxID=35761 RepID=UPI0039E6ECAD
MIRVTASVGSDSPDVVTRAVEALSRAAVGLALEGIDAVVIVAHEDEEGEDK